MKKPKDVYYETSADAGLFATSLAGHDCGQTYMVVGEYEGYIYLADGKSKTLTQPKRKNKKHVQLIKRGYPVDIRERLVARRTVRDEEIRLAIKQYERERATCQNQI